MNDHWEELMWAYVDKKLDQSQENDLLQQLKKNRALNSRFNDIKALHVQLNKMPVHLPEASLSSQIMNNITNQEIEAHLKADQSKKDMPMIPIILLVFGSLLFTGIIMVWVFSGSDYDYFSLPFKLDFSDRSASIIGYAGLLLLCVVLMYRFSQDKQHESI